MNYTVVPASIRHIKLLDATLRGKEFLFGTNSRRALRIAFLQSTYAKTALIDGKPVAMWGVMKSAMSDEGEAWAAFSQEAIKHPKAMIKDGRQEAIEMARHAGTLYAKINPADPKSEGFSRALGFVKTGIFAEQFEIIVLGAQICQFP
jgi:hypothetical protein